MIENEEDCSPKKIWNFWNLNDLETNNLTLTVEQKIHFSHVWNIHTGNKHVVQCIMHQVDCIMMDADAIYRDRMCKYGPLLTRLCHYYTCIRHKSFPNRHCVISSYFRGQWIVHPDKHDHASLLSLVPLSRLSF
jgi:hypothetical protein